MQTRLRTRAFVAMCGTFGFELDISTATPKDLLGEGICIMCKRVQFTRAHFSSLYVCALSTPHFLFSLLIHIIFYHLFFDHTAFRQQIDMYKQLSPIIRWGDIYRLWDPFKVRII